MTDRAVPPREAVSALILLLLLAAAVFWVEPSGLGGPLPLVCAIAVFHAALLGPAVGGGASAGWRFLPLVIAFPALAVCSFGRGGLATLAGAAGLLLLCCMVGWAADEMDRKGWGGLYRSLLLLLFFAPFALAYLVAEFDGRPSSEFWRGASPLALAWKTGQGDGFGAALLLPVFFFLLPSVFPAKEKPE